MIARAADPSPPAPLPQGERGRTAALREVLKRFLRTQDSALSTQDSALSTQDSALSTQDSALSTQDFVSHARI